MAYLSRIVLKLLYNVICYVSGKLFAKLLIYIFMIQVSVTCNEYIIKYIVYLMSYFTINLQNFI